LIKILLMVVVLAIEADAQPCVGRFINPITDVCWSCLMPITLASISIGKTSKAKNRDTRNPSSPLCGCIKGGLPVPGVTIGFWEPIRLIDVTRTPYCMVGLGGIEIMQNRSRISSYRRASNVHSSFYHLHYYMYPLLYWLELITDFVCLERGTFDLAYMSELDVSYNDSKIQNLLHPENILFANPIAQAVCSMDCTAATTDLPRDELFWCAGCLGNLYPFSGYNADHYGGVQSSSLLAIRTLAKMHRVGLAQRTATADSRVNGEICKKSYAPKIVKSQYKLQMVYPKTSSGDFACVPLGMTDLLYGAFKEYPNDGQDWSYLLWRKKNCCAF
jgi:conjugal transfer pilus assembly protein TraU